MVLLTPAPSPNTAPIAPQPDCLRGEIPGAAVSHCPWQGTDYLNLTCSAPGVVLNDFMVITGNHLTQAGLLQGSQSPGGKRRMHSLGRSQRCDKWLLHMVCGDVFGSHLGCSLFQEAGMGPDPVSLRCCTKRLRFKFKGLRILWNKMIIWVLQTSHL